jgi:lipid-A-disaccharide synthase
MSSNQTPKQVMIVTGEASGDLHGANLIRAAAEVAPGVEFFGIGGQEMKSAGCDVLMSGDELAVMGIVEVLGHFPVIWRAFQRLKKILHSHDRPDALVLIDFPEFNLRLARQAKKAGVPVLYYVSPQVWAWRRGRVKKIAKVVDKLAAIFPFEPELYDGLDIDVKYVGHPLLDEIKAPVEKSDFLEEFGIPADKKIVGLFPGSRRSEINYMFDTLLEAGKEIARQEPNCFFLVPLASSLREEGLQQRIGESGLDARLVEAEIYDSINACDAILSVSGTVTLQIAMGGTPLAIFYKVAPLTYFIGRLLIKVDFIGLANIVAGRQVAKEFIQEEASAESLSGEIVKILRDEPYRNDLKNGLSDVQSRMGEPGCSKRVAEMLSELVFTESVAH